MRQIEAKNAQEDQGEPFNSFRFDENIFTGPRKEYISKGGVLCDAIGMGKTATMYTEPFISINMLRRL